MGVHIRSLNAPVPFTHEYQQGFAFVVLIIKLEAQACKRYGIDVTPDDFIDCLDAANTLMRSKDQYANVPIDNIFSPLMVPEFPFDKLAKVLQEVDNVTPDNVKALVMKTPGHPVVRLCSFLYGFADFLEKVDNVTPDDDKAGPRLCSFLGGLADGGLRLDDLHRVINYFRPKAEYLRCMVRVDYEEVEIEVYKKAIWLEASHEPCEAQLVMMGEITAPLTWVAVAHVIRNRALTNRKHFGGPSIAGVCERPRQFLCWNKLETVQPEGEKWDRMDKWVRCVLDGMMSDPTRGAMHYINPAKHNPIWAKEMKVGAKIANRHFLQGE